MNAWWESFFDEDYVWLWEGFLGPDQTQREADGLRQLLGLRSGARVLDAPCGYGRLAQALAARGAVVLGVDQSAALLDEAERRRADLPEARLSYRRHDLRTALPDGGFDHALNVFSSLGYGSEKEDLDILTTLRGSVRPGGSVFVETNHRDAVVALLSRGAKPASRLPDGTLVVEEPTLDAVSGRIETRWHWSGPRGSGSKAASLRVYTVTELVRLVERAGLRLRSVHRGCSPDPFAATGPDMGGRVGVLAVRD